MERKIGEGDEEGGVVGEGKGQVAAFDWVVGGEGEGGRGLGVWVGDGVDGEGARVEGEGAGVGVGEGEEGGAVDGGGGEV